MTVSEIFRGTDVGEFITKTFGEFSKLRHGASIGDMLAVPRQKIIDVPNHRNFNVKGVAHLARGN